MVANAGLGSLAHPHVASMVLRALCRRAARVLMRLGNEDETEREMERAKALAAKPGEALWSIYDERAGDRWTGSSTR